MDTRVVPVVAVALTTVVCSAAAGQDWKPVRDLGEVRTIVTGRTLLMYKTRQQFHRHDGNMIEYFLENHSFTVRKWSVREDGAICWKIFSKPDHVIDCAMLQRGEGEALRYKWENVQGAPPLEILETNPPELITELDAQAGPAK